LEYNPYLGRKDPTHELLVQYTNIKSLNDKGRQSLVYVPDMDCIPNNEFRDTLHKVLSDIVNLPNVTVIASMVTDKNYCDDFRELFKP
jgi:hypothetical protein